MTKVLRAYYVWPAFPSISITGSACHLNCIHCNKVYLKHMHNANRPERLIEMCETFKQKGAKGVLISGGCNKFGGLLNLDKFIPALAQVHKMGLIIKLHTGLVDKTLAEQIADAGIEIASQEIVGDTETVKEIFDLDLDVSNYFQTFKHLQSAGVPYLCPHLCVGLHRGKLKGELHALEMMERTFIPSTLAIIAFRPTKGTALQSIPAPNPNDLGTIVAAAKEMFPKTKIILGAMRPRSSTRNDPNKKIRIELERAALDNDIDGIEIPAPDTIKLAKERGWKIKRVESYGVLPIELEDKVESKGI